MIMGASNSVSVIVPIYNSASTLEASLKSLLDQSLKEIEIIVVDDASTDESNNIISRFAQKYNNIVSIRFSENRGVHEARLAGISKASADWIGFLDADDYARPDMYKMMLNSAIEQNVDIAVCGSVRVNSRRQYLRKRNYFNKSKLVNQDVFKKFCHLEFGDGALWNKLYKSHTLKDLHQHKFPWRQNINEDLITNILAFHKAKSVYLMNNVLHEYIVNSNSVTANQNSVNAYTSTFRAYAAALLAYQDFDDSSILNITLLYRKQFELVPYRLHDLESSFDDHHLSDLCEASRVIQEIYPQGLGLLCCRSSDISHLSIKFLAKNLINRLISRFHESL